MTGWPGQVFQVAKISSTKHPTHQMLNILSTTWSIFGPQNATHSQNKEKQRYWDRDIKNRRIKARERERQIDLLKVWTNLHKGKILEQFLPDCRLNYSRSCRNYVHIFLYFEVNICSTSTLIYREVFECFFHSLSVLQRICFNQIGIRASWLMYVITACSSKYTLY